MGAQSDLRGVAGGSGVIVGARELGPGPIAITSPSVVLHHAMEGVQAGIEAQPVEVGALANEPHVIARVVDVARVLFQKCHKLRVDLVVGGRARNHGVGDAVDGCGAVRDGALGLNQGIE